MGALIELLTPYVSKVIPVVPYLLKFWRETLIALLTFFIWYQNTSETRYLMFAETIPHLEKKLASSKEEIDTCKAGNETLVQSIDRQNTEILKWKEISDKLEQSNKQLIKQLGEIRNMTNTHAAEILAGKTPKTCADSINYLRDGVKDLKWSK